MIGHRYQAVVVKDRFSGGDLCQMFTAATALLERNVESINALNVFPVPDGDTGTNMFLTMRDCMERANTVRGSSASEVAKAMYEAAFMGARGNSGVILSQFLKGVALGLDSVDEFGAEEITSAFQQAREHAYKAVADPKEGTILTVISRIAEAARVAQEQRACMQDVFEAVCEAAEDAVARTPTMLAVLRDAGVVDAGGQGLAVILEGMRRCVAGDSQDAGVITPPNPIGVDGTSGAVSREFLDNAEEEIYGYCTQFMIQGEGLDTDAIRDALDDMALSTVVVGDESNVRVHIHTEDPGLVLSFGVAHGTLAQVNIQNMDEQRTQFSATQRAEVSAKVLETAVVAVALGGGLKAVFRDLGASEVVSGGDTMNPSVQEIVAAIESVPSDHVVVLPNNGNIVPAAEQAAEYSSKAVKVVQTRSIPQGIAAMVVYDSDHDMESNVGLMSEALNEVRSAEITKAVRAVTLDGVEVQEGRFIGLLDRVLVAAGDNVGDVLLSVLEKANVREELVTLYWGEQLSSDQAKELKKKATATFGDIEIELVQGGQPHYELLISIE